MQHSIGAQGFTAEVETFSDGSHRLSLLNATRQVIAVGYMGPPDAMPAEPAEPVEPVREDGLSWHDRHRRDPSWPRSA